MSRSIQSRFFLVSLLGAGALLGQQVPRAIPVEDDAPAVPRAIPVEPDSAPSAAPARRKGPEEDLFDYASLVYDRGEYVLAGQSFGKYLQAYPSGRYVPVALFRLAECFMKQNELKLAETYYEEVVSRYPDSEGAPSAAYRLGAMRFNARDFAQSARYFAFSEAKSTLPQVRLAAAFNKARSYQMLGDVRQQMAALQQVIAVKADNPYREAATMTLGTLLLATDRKSEALPLFQNLIDESKDNAIVSEASVKAAVLLAETGKPEAAEPLFERALTISETPPVNRGIALVGLVQSLFAKGDYDGVIDRFHRNSNILPEGETRPKMLLLVGNAYRMKKSYARAVEVYLMVEQEYADSDAAFEAGYWKLYCFYLLDDKDLGDFATTFIQRYQESRAGHEFLNLAQLIQADFYFNKQDYAKAADSFSVVSLDKLPAKLRPSTTFNKAWSLAEAERHQEAIGVFSLFLAENPGHELTAKALARRGLAYRAVKDPVKAVADFERVVKEFTHSEAAEIAYLQLGLIASGRRDAKATIAAFEMLVKKYPASAAAGQAWYGIGSSYYDLQQWDKATEALAKAIELDKKTYLDPASQMLIRAQYAQQNTEGLARAVETYRKANSNANIPLNILSWLGLKLYDQQEPARAAHFLEMASTPDVPENTDPRVWNYLAMARLEAKDHAGSLKAIDHFLAVTPESAARARGLLTKGRALLGLGRVAEAERVVQEGLAFAKDGKPQALLLVLEGDVLLAEGNQLAASGNTSGAREKYQAAAGKFMVPAQFFEDIEVTPEALAKAAEALEKAGQPEKAAEFRKQLAERYPKSEAP